MHANKFALIYTCACARQCEYVSADTVSTLTKDYDCAVIPFECNDITTCLDGFMNIAMEQTEEYVNGQLKAKYGDAFIRGNNGVTTH